MKDAIPGSIGVEVPYKGTKAVTVRHIPTEYGSLSTFFEAKVEGQDELVVVHENLVKEVMAGTYVPEAIKVKGPRVQRTKKERAVDHVREMLRKRMSRGEVIKALAKVLRVSRGTAQTYYYQVKG